MAKIKAHSLTGRITPDIMHTAFRNVKRNRGAAGIDKVSITLYENNLEQNWWFPLPRIEARKRGRPMKSN